VWGRSARPATPRWLTPTFTWGCGLPPTRRATSIRSRSCRRELRRRRRQHRLQPRSSRRPAPSSPQRRRLRPWRRRPLRLSPRRFPLPPRRLLLQQRRTHRRRPRAPLGPPPPIWSSAAVAGRRGRSRPQQCRPIRAPDGTRQRRRPLRRPRERPSTRGRGSPFRSRPSSSTHRSCRPCATPPSQPALRELSGRRTSGTRPPEWETRRRAPSGALRRRSSAGKPGHRWPRALRRRSAPAVRAARADRRGRSWRGRTRCCSCCSRLLSCSASPRPGGRVARVAFV
jgi:hypothetical protein